MCSLRTERLGKILIAAGGTGGHIFPAQALASRLLGIGFQPALVTDRRGMELGCDQLGVPCHTLYAGPFSRQSWVGLLLAVIKLSIGMVQARVLIHRLAPVAAVGFGGYASLPMMLMAARMKLPTVIHEANAVLGRANRFLAPRVSAIATSFQNTSGVAELYQGKVVETGTPVRADIVALRELVTQPLNSNSKIRLLIVGGSQGSRIMSEVVPAALARLPSWLRDRLVIVHQCRASDQANVEALFAMGGISASVIPFIENMAAALKAAHLVVSRAGASIVAELAVAGRPALLVPFSHATDDHQTANARALVDAGGAWMIDEKEFNVVKLETWLVELFKNPSVLVAASRKARAIGQPDAAHCLADVTSQVISEYSGV